MGYKIRLGLGRPQKTDKDYYSKILFYKNIIQHMLKPGPDSETKNKMVQSEQKNTTSNKKKPARN